MYVCMHTQTALQFTAFYLISFLKCVSVCLPAWVREWVNVNDDADDEDRKRTNERKSKRTTWMLGCGWCLLLLLALFLCVIMDFLSLFFPSFLFFCHTKSNKNEKPCLPRCSASQPACMPAWLPAFTKLSAPLYCMCVRLAVYVHHPRGY